MDFRQTTQPASRPASNGVSASTSAEGREKNSNRKRDTKWFKVLNAVVLIGGALLIAAVALAVARGDSGNEAKYVNHKKYQAVFLNNGQVYFGNITSLNSRYVHLNNIYYLTQSSSDTSNNAASNSNYSLVKLGCQQIHDPYDEMVINREQVTFWENLQDSGKVVSSIKQFIKQNPKGPDCSQVSTQTQATGNTPTQGSTNK